MRTHVERMGRWLGASLVGGALVLAGCGGGATGAGAKAAKSPKGTVLKTAGGATINVEAHSHWMDGLKRFQKYEKEGWSPDKCSATIDDFKDAVDAQEGGKFAEAQYMAGLTAARCNQMDDAKDFWEGALDTNSKLCKARVAIGVLQLRQGNAKAAFDTFKRSINDDARCTEGYVDVAIMQRRMGAKNVDEARMNLRRALAIESQYLPAFNELALLFYEQGEKKREQLDLAEVVCRQAQLLNKDYAPIYNTWGLIKMRKGDIIEALRFFARARDLDASIFEAHMNFGEITLSFRGYDDAKDAFSKAVQLEPKDYEAHLGLGAAYRGLEQYDQAEAEYKKAIDINDKRPEAYFNLALIYHDYKSGMIPDLKQAEKYYKDFLARAKGSSEYNDTVEDVTRRCRKSKSKHRQWRNKDCRPGRLQNLEMAVDALKEMEQMQREAAEMQKQQQQQQQKQ